MAWAPPDRADRAATVARDRSPAPVARDRSPATSRPHDVDDDEVRELLERVRSAGHTDGGIGEVTANVAANIFTNDFDHGPLALRGRNDLHLYVATCATAVVRQATTFRCLGHAKS